MVRLRRRVAVASVGLITALLAAVGLAPSPVQADQRYDRSAAASWAARHYATSYYYENGTDCTFFVSRALWAGGLPKSAAWIDSTTDRRYVASRWKLGPQPSRVASASDYLKNYLVSETRMATIRELSFSQPSIPDAQLGDLIAYDWDAPGPDGFIDHLAIITGFAGQYPLVSAHSMSLYNGLWDWSYRYQQPIVEAYVRDGNGPRAYLIHITY